MGAFGVVAALPSEQLRRQRCYSPLAVVELVELFLMGAVPPLHVAVQLRGTRGQDEQPDVPLPALLELPAELGASSTWIALRGNGRRRWMASRKRTALAAMACVPTWSASQRETTSRAVKCLKTRPRSGRRSMVSTWTRSPGSVGM